MAEEEVLVLPDKNVIPDDSLIFSHIGGMKPIWIAIMDHVRDNYKDTHGGWRYYNDGKQWLFKMQQKKKTLFWIAILSGTYRITFYYGKKADPLIEAGNLPQKMKDDYKTSKQYGLIKAISIKVTGKSDFETVKELILIRQKVK